MPNSLITRQQMEQEVWDSLKQHGILDALEKATPEDRADMIKALMNFFGAKFP